MKCAAMRLIAMLLFVSITKMLAERISVNNYVSLIDDVRKYYDATNVNFVYRDDYQDLNVSTTVYEWSREFSRRQIMTAIISLSDLVNGYKEYGRRIVRPFFVVLLDNEQTMSEFVEATRRTVPMSSSVWFVLFLPRPENPLEKYCRHPTNNVFNVNFNTLMLVRCYDHPILTEWYAVRDNRTRTFELATWSLDEGLILTTQDSLHERRSDLFGDVIRVASVQESPFIKLRNDEATGFLGSLLMELSYVMNFTVKFLHQAKAYGSYIRYRNTWTGVIGQLLRDEADFGVSEFSITLGRLKVVDFTLPLIRSRNRLYIKEPDGSDVQWLGYLKAFSYGIWAGILMIIVCVPILLSIMTKKRRFSFSLVLENYIYIWGIYCQQGLAEFPNESSTRFAFFSVFFSSIIINSSYSASLISFLTLRTVTLPFSTLEGFIENGAYKLIVVKNNADYDTFNNAKNPLFLKLNSSMKDRTLLPLTGLEGFQQVCKEKVAFYTTESVKNAVPQKCKVAFAETGRADSMAIMLQKGSPYTGVVNYYILRFLDNGMIKRLKERYIVTNNPSKAVDRSVVGVQGVAPILSVVAGGMILGMIILILEKTYYTFNTKYKNSKFSNVKKLNGKRGRKLQAKLRKSRNERNPKLRRFYDNTIYVKSIGYWP